MTVVVWYEREAAASCVYGVRKEWLPIVCVCWEKQAAGGGGNGLCCRWECERVRLWVCAAGGEKEKVCVAGSCVGDECV